MKKIRILGIFVSFLFLISCGGGGGSGGSTGGVTDTTAPTVLSTGPADTATGVNLDALITATFSKAMDVSTITATTFTLNTNPPVTGTVSYDTATNTATFTPSSDLAASTTHTATITQGAKDSAGNSMAADYTWSFTTAAAIVVGGTVDLPETGQQSCYDATGSVIACAGTGQDGDVLAGVVWPVPRFMDNMDGTLTDSLTGLMWLQDANCIATQYPAFDTENIDGDGAVPWQNTLDFVSGINAGTYPDCSAGYTDWRLPNVNELESLINAEQSNSATWLIGEGFTNVDSDYYWSATTYGGQSASAWHVKMWQGHMQFTNKTINFIRYLWPVRATTTLPAQLWKTGQTISYAAGDDGELQTGVTWPSPRYTDNGDGTITDKLTTLTWTQDANAPGPAGCTTAITMTWQDALSYVACLNTNNYLGFSDWRLPNKKELHSLTDFSQTTPALPSGHPFTNVQLALYWSATTYADLKDSAWDINMNTGTKFFILKSNLNYVWPVR